MNLALLPIALRVLPFSIYIDQALFLAVVVSAATWPTSTTASAAGIAETPARRPDTIPQPIAKD